MSGKYVDWDRNLFLTLLAVLVSAVLLLGATGCQPQVEDTQSPQETISEEITPPPFNCSGGGEGEELECTAESIGGEAEVIVTVPWQGQTVDVVAVPFPDPIEREVSVSEGDDYSIARLVTNFQVETDDSKVLRRFDPAIELRVSYTAEHWAQALEMNAEYLHMAYWDFDVPDDEPRWIDFTEAKHSFDIEGDGNGGFLFAAIADWGDPLIGSGP